MQILTPDEAHKYWVDRLLSYNHVNQPTVSIALICTIAIEIQVENFTKIIKPLPLHPKECSKVLYRRLCDRFKTEELLMVLDLADSEVPL